MTLINGLTRLSLILKENSLLPTTLHSLAPLPLFNSFSFPFPSVVPRPHSSVWLSLSVLYSAEGVTGVDLFKINEPRIVAEEASCEGTFPSTVSGG